MKVLAILFKAILSLAFDLRFGARALISSAARAISRYLNCAEWPETGTRRRMWLTVPTALLSASGAAWLIRRRKST